MRKVKEGDVLYVEDCKQYVTVQPITKEGTELTVLCVPNLTDFDIPFVCGFGTYIPVEDLTASHKVRNLGREVRI